VLSQEFGELRYSSESVSTGTGSERAIVSRFERSTSLGVACRGASTSPATLSPTTHSPELIAERDASLRVPGALPRTPPGRSVAPPSDEAQHWWREGLPRLLPVIA
jgi:hypothetical protein